MGQKWTKLAGEINNEHTIPALFGFCKTGSKSCIYPDHNFRHRINNWVARIKKLSLQHQRQFLTVKKRYHTSKTDLRSSDQLE